VSHPSHRHDRQEIELFHALEESATSICRASEDYALAANIFSSEITDIKKYQSVQLKTFLLHSGAEFKDHGDDDEAEDEDEDGEGRNDFGELIEMNSKIFQKIVRRRSVIETNNKKIAQKVFRKNSVTAALQQIIPPTVSSTGWDFTHLLALSTTTRFSLSKGLLKHLLACLSSFHQSSQPSAVSLLVRSPHHHGSLEKTYQLIRPLYEYILTTPIHPAATPIVLSLQHLYSLIVSQQLSPQGQRINSEQTLYHGKTGLKVLMVSLTGLMTSIREIAADSPQCLSFVAKINSLLEEIICKFEGNYRANILTQIYSSILLNSFVIDLPQLPETDPSVISAEEYLKVKFPHPLYPQRLLTPMCDRKWLDYLFNQEKSVLLILNQRKVSSESDRVAADIARSSITSCFSIAPHTY
jgi:hypothetical protein